MRLISVREEPAYAERAIAYLHQNWPDVPRIVYADCVTHSVSAAAPLPQWYLLEEDGMLIGCAGLITNDFISRMDLYPWLCAVYIDEAHRGKRLSLMLIERAMADARSAGFQQLYLSTDHIGLYERFGFSYIGDGHHPWEASSRIYQRAL